MKRYYYPPFRLSGSDCGMSYRVIPAAELIQVIRMVRWKWDETPVRPVVCYYMPDGEPICEYDPVEEGFEYRGDTYYPKGIVADGPTKEEQ